MKKYNILIYFAKIWGFGVFIHFLSQRYRTSVKITPENVFQKQFLKFFIFWSFLAKFFPKTLSSSPFWIFHTLAYIGLQHVVLLKILQWIQWRHPFDVILDKKMFKWAKLKIFIKIIHILHKFGVLGFSFIF